MPILLPARGLASDKGSVLFIDADRYYGNNSGSIVPVGLDPDANCVDSMSDHRTNPS